MKPIRPPEYDGVGTGRIPPSAAHKIITGILSDEEWHGIQELIDALAQSGVPVPRTERNASYRAFIRRFYYRTAYEVEFEQRGKRHVAQRIRRRPGVNEMTRVRTCVNCGRSHLAKEESVRKEISYWQVGRQTRRSLARLTSTYLCLVCAEEEVTSRGATWLRPPGEEASNEQGEREGESS